MKRRDLRSKVLVWGTFDNLHDGHRRFLEQASRLGLLYVIVVPDDAVLENKGRAPLFAAEDRAAQLRMLPFVAGVQIDSWAGGLESLRVLQPNYFCAGYDQSRDWEMQLIQFCKSAGLRIGYIRLGEYAGGIHSSHLRT